MLEGERPPALGRRGALVGLLFLGLALALLHLGFAPGGLRLRAAGWSELGAFLRAALQPALDYEGATAPARAQFFARLGAAVRDTVFFAAASVALALPFGFGLGLLGSFALWGGRRALPSAARLVAACLRSVHELLWAVLFLAAFGLVPAAAALALALPYVGILAKVGSELLDEAPERAEEALHGLGARRRVAFLVGRLPAAAADMAGYAFYRFECSLRSAAVLGFFGFPTLGYYIAESAQHGRYRSLWTHLWALVLLVLLVEAWGARLRRRFVV